VRIGIDARFLTHSQRGGFKTYTESLIAALGEIDGENEYVLYLDRHPDTKSQVPNRLNFTTRIVPSLLPVVGMPWREQVGLSREINHDRLDLFHSPNLTAPLHLGCPLVVTIHDIIWFFPEKFSRGSSWSARRRLMEWYYRWVPRYAAKNASAIITVSQAAKQSIVEHLELDCSHIFVTYEAASPIFRPMHDAKQIGSVRHKYHLPAEFTLAIGSADPRKNIKTLVQAYALLSAELQARYQLVIVWTHSLLVAELTKQIESFGLTERVHFLEGVSNEDLVLIYNAASLFVFPSLYEGFGLPLLEAMACGTPVVAANNSSIPEIAGDAALLVEAKDANAIADAMARILSDETIHSTLKRIGLERAASFSWEKCAQETMAIYRRALQSRKGSGRPTDAYSP
jgi:glycosyltransferase involved in cell wall biosynthesis